MNNKKDCKIIQDLLPNYIEKLTNEETNSFIETHLNHCEECKDIFTNMKEEPKEKELKKEKREVKYIKKYNKKLRFFKVVLLLIITIFVIITARKMIIITDLSKKASRYINSNNYYEKTIAYNGENMIINEIYHKNEKTVTIMRRITENETNKISTYKNGDKANIYWDSKNVKKAQLNTDSGLPIYIVNYFETSSFIQTLMLSTIANIKRVEYNGKECYFITNYFSSNMLVQENEGVWIDKETGLMIKNTGGITNSNGTVTNFYYEFGTVNDDIFVEPNLSEYDLK